MTFEVGELGQKLAVELDKRGLAVHAAMWLYDAPNDSYLLTLVTPLVNSKGPAYVYEKIQRALADLKNKDNTLRDIALSDIRVVSPNEDEQISAVISLVNQAKPGGPNRFSKNSFNGHYVEDMMLLWTRPA